LFVLGGVLCLFVWGVVGCLLNAKLTTSTSFVNAVNCPVKQ